MSVALRHHLARARFTASFGIDGRADRLVSGRAPRLETLRVVRAQRIEKGAPRGKAVDAAALRMVVHAIRPPPFETAELVGGVARTIARRIRERVAQQG